MTAGDGQTALFIQPDSDAGLLSGAGLEAGDELVSVNQYDLREGSLSDLFQTLQSEKEFVFVIKRGERTLTRTLVIG